MAVLYSDSTTFPAIADYSKRLGPHIHLHPVKHGQYKRDIFEHNVKIGDKINWKHCGKTYEVIVLGIHDYETIKKDFGKFNLDWRGTDWSHFVMVYHA